MLSRLRISARLILVGLVPTLALVYFAGLDCSQRWRELTEGSRLVTLVGAATRTGDLIHGLQRKRGATSLFVSSRGARFGGELGTYRAEVDRGRGALEEFLGAHRGDLPESVVAAADRARVQLGGLAEQRRVADAFGAPPQTLITYYTGRSTGCWTRWRR